MITLLASLPPKRKRHTRALYPVAPPATCPAAALMARRSQIELAIPVAVSAAHAPFHRKSRRVGSSSCDLLRRLMAAPSKFVHTEKRRRGVLSILSTLHR